MDIGIRYIMSQSEKPIAWVGSSLSDLKKFPEEAKREAGYDLGLVQNGLDPRDFKPMEEVGKGTYEIRINTDVGGNVQHRVFFVAKFPEAVYVLHSFRKTTRETSTRDKKIGKKRYGEMLADRREMHQRNED